MDPAMMIGDLCGWAVHLDILRDDFIFQLKCCLLRVLSVYIVQCGGLRLYSSNWRVTTVWAR